MIFTIIFGKLAGIPTDGIPQILFYMCGITCWNYFAECLTKTSTTFTSNANIFGKVLVTIFGLCTVFFGYNVFSFLYSNQLSQSFRLSELQSTGVEISSLSQQWIDFMGYTVVDGPSIPFGPEPTAYIFLITLAVMVIAGVWVNLSKN